jgi:hypothetical protein
VNLSEYFKEIPLEEIFETFDLNTYAKALKATVNPYDLMMNAHKYI